MLRRGVGIGAIKKREQAQHTFAAVGAALESNQLAHLQSSLATFRSSLEQFAFQHKHAIAHNPVFRAQFHRMCLSIGVDPLACHKGFWSQLLNLGDFYFELGVEIMDVCLKSRPENGGLMRVEDVRKRLMIKYKDKLEITHDDISQSVSKLSCLGSGFVLLPVGGPSNLGDHLLKSVPLEMNLDHLALINFVQEGASHTPSSSAAAVSSSTKSIDNDPGCIRPTDLSSKLGWSRERISTCLSLLLEEGMIWVDAQTKGETTYYLPAIAMADTAQ